MTIAHRSQYFHGVRIRNCVLEFSPDWSTSAALQCDCCVGIRDAHPRLVPIVASNQPITNTDSSVNQAFATASQSTQVPIRACFPDTAYLGVAALSSREADSRLAFVWGRLKGSLGSRIDGGHHAVAPCSATAEGNHGAAACSAHWWGMTMSVRSSVAASVATLVLAVCGPLYTGPEGQLLSSTAHAESKLRTAQARPAQKNPADQLRSQVETLINSLRGRDMPQGIVKSNGRIEATQFDVAANYPARLATLT